jgi:hypothetical protein
MFGRTWIRYLDTNYEVNQLGEVRHIRTKREVAPQPHYKRELRVRIGKKNVRVHIMVCTCFKKKLLGCPLVDHLDGDKQNNHVNNLNWVSHAENTRRAVKMGFINMDRVRSFRKTNPNTYGKNNPPAT